MQCGPVQTDPSQAPLRVMSHAMRLLQLPPSISSFQGSPIIALSLLRRPSLSTTTPRLTLLGTPHVCHWALRAHCTPPLRYTQFTTPTNMRSTARAATALAATAALLFPSFTTALWTCDAAVDGHKYSFKDLGGRHEVVWSRETPPTVRDFISPSPILLSIGMIWA